MNVMIVVVNVMIVLQAFYFACIHGNIINCVSFIK